MGTGSVPIVAELARDSPNLTLGDAGLVGYRPEAQLLTQKGIHGLLLDLTEHGLCYQRFSSSAVHSARGGIGPTGTKSRLERTPLPPLIERQRVVPSDDVEVSRLLSHVGTVAQCPNMGHVRNDRFRRPLAATQKFLAHVCLLGVVDPIGCERPSKVFDGSRCR